jgi:hypothetical protein
MADVLPWLTEFGFIKRENDNRWPFRSGTIKVMGKYGGLAPVRLISSSVRTVVAFPLEPGMRCPKNGAYRFVGTFARVLSESIRIALLEIRFLLEIAIFIST